MKIARISKSALVASVAFGALMVGTPAFAAAEAAAQDAQSTGGLEDIVVTARRVGESAQEAPISITTLSSDALRTKVIQSASDLAKETPSLQIITPATSPSGLSYSLRAQVQTDTGAATGSGTGVYFGDVYLGSATIAGGLLNLKDLERVEVLKGPQGTLYGRNVTGGVVKFVPKQPTYESEGSVTAGVGNYERRYLEGMVNLPLVADRVAVRLVGLIDDRGGYSHDIVNDREMEDQKKWSVRGSLKIDASDNFSILAQGWMGRFKSGANDVRTTYIAPGVNVASMNIMVSQGINGITAGALAPIIFGAPSAANPVPSAAFLAAFGAASAALPAVTALVDQQLNAPRNQVRGGSVLRGFALGTTAKSGGGALTLEYDLGSLTLKSITAYDFGQRNGNFNVGGGPWIPILTNQFGQTKQWTQELQANGTAFDSRMKYALGLFLLDAKYRDDRNQSSKFGAFPTFLGQLGLGVTSGSTQFNNLQTTGYGVYGQVTYAVTDAINLTGGLRYTDEKQSVQTFASQDPNLANGGRLTCIGPAPLTSATPVAQCFSSASTKSNALSYTAGIDWTVADNILIYAKTSRGFKAGGINAFTAAGAPISGFKPEINTDYEIGFKSQFLDNRVRLNLAYYHTKYDDIQRVVAKEVAPNVIATSVQNAADAKIDGVEGELMFVPVDGLTFAATGAYTNPRYGTYFTTNAAFPGGRQDLSGNEFQGVAKYTYSLSGAYDFATPVGGAHVELIWSHRSDTQLFENDVNPTTPGGTNRSPRSATSQPAFGVLNGSFSLKVDDWGAMVTVWGKNILNKRYRESATALSNAGVPYGWSSYGAPATYGVDVSVRF